MAEDSEFFVRLGGRDHRCIVCHYADQLRLQAVVTIVEGVRNGETIVVPVHDLRPDFTALQGPGEDAPAWAGV